MKKIFIIHFLIYANLSFASEVEDLKTNIDTLELDKQLEILAFLNFDFLVANSQELIPVFHKYIDQANNESHLDYRARLYNKLSIAYYYNGKYDKNITYGLKAIELFDSLDNKIEVGTLYGELGYQMKRRELNRAFELMQKGISILEKVGEIEPLAKIYDNYGVLHEMKTNFDSASFYYKKALNFKRKMNDSLGIPYSLNNLFMIHLAVQNFDSALFYLNESTKIRNLRNDQIGIAENYNYYGKFYYEQNLFIEAIDFFEKALQIALNHNYRYLIQHLYREISRSYEAINQYNKALHFHKLYKQLQDSILNEETNKAIAELEVRFETVEKEKALEKKNLELESKSLQIVILFISLVVIILCFILLYTRYRQKQKNLLQKKLLEEKKQRLTFIIKAQDEERKRIARDLHDGIGQILSAVSMKTSEIIKKLDLKDDKEINELNESQSMLNNACDELRSISHQMMPRSISETGLVTAIKEMIFNTLKNTNIKFTFDTFGFKERLEENIEIGLYRISQELINNVIKHADCTNINVQLYRNKNAIILIVEDDGKGISNQKNTGMGLQNITSRAEAINGTFNIEKAPEKGTIATVKILIKIESEK